MPLLKLVFGIFFSSPEKAREPVVFLSTSTDVEEKAFDYLFLMERKEIDSKANDPENGKLIWEKSQLLLSELSFDI